MGVADHHKVDLRGALVKEVDGRRNDALAGGVGRDTTARPNQTRRQSRASTHSACMSARSSPRWLASHLWPEPRDRRAALRDDRISQERHALHLDEGRRVPDKSELDAVRCGSAAREAAPISEGGSDQRTTKQVCFDDATNGALSLTRHHRTWRIG